MLGDTVSRIGNMTGQIVAFVLINYRSLKLSFFSNANPISRSA